MSGRASLLETTAVIRERAAIRLPAVVRAIAAAAILPPIPILILILILTLIPSLALTGCGSNYEPPVLEATGLPAEPLGQVIDLEISLPGVQITGASTRGIDLELRFEIEQVGYGRLDARVVPVRARVDQRSAAVEDLSDGRVELLVTPTRWTPSMIGPLRVEGAIFDLILDGVPEENGWRVAGRSWESQSGLFDTFEGWRRHRFLVAGSDFFSSVGRVFEVAWVKRRELVVRDRLELVSSDPVLRVTNASVFAINRFTFDNLQRLDPTNDFATSWQAGVGPGANPQDALLLSDERGYLTRYEPPFNDVAVFDARYGTIRASIPLEGLAENRDATPRPSRMREADGLVFVGLQDIDRTFTRFGEGKLAVIDPALDEVVGVVPLGGKNPGAIERLTGSDGRTKLYVALSGIFPGLVPGELSGGVVVVDAGNRAVERLALDDDDLGGNVGALAMVSERLGYVVASDASFRNRVLAFDPLDGHVLREVYASGELISELEVDSGGVLAIPDRTFAAPGVCLFMVPTAGDADAGDAGAGDAGAGDAGDAGDAGAGDAGAGETRIACVSTELPPFSIEALD
jgi:hypothetical protein